MLDQKTRGPRRRLVAFRMREAGAPPPRPHYTVWGCEGDGTPLGETTSGTLSPTLGVGIGMAYVPVAHAAPGTQLQVEIRGRRHPAEVARRPLYRRPQAAS